MLPLHADDSKKGPSFAVAAEHLLSGEYSQAIVIYEKLGQAPGKTIRAECERSAIDLLTGTYREGIARLEAVKSAGRNSHDWHVSLAALLAAVGDYEKAVQHNRKAVSLDDRGLRGHWQLGQVLEALGKTRAAIDAYEIFEEILTGDTFPEDAGADGLTLLGQGFYRYSTLTQTNLVNRTKYVLQEIYQEAFDFVDARYWPARLATAELLLAKHNLREAKEDFERVLQQNPNVPDALVGLGRAHLEDWAFEAVEERVKSALAVNPNHVGAMVLLADTRMTERRYHEASELAQKALAVNPNSIEALAVLAAAQLRSGDKAAAGKTHDRVKKINPKSAVFHETMGRWLSAGRQYVEAEPHLKKAIEHAPWWSAPRTALGQLYMEKGEESLARKSLEASFKLDSFNRHTHNVLELLDSLDTFSKMESKHFIIKYDSKDALVAPYFSESLEEMYSEVCDNFEAELSKPTIIELFPDHEGFSVRVTGRPFIATVGACTGRVIAMCAPRGRPPFGRFNWASVLRHEFTHTVTLAATENRIPHWMTEGLAVYEEPAPRSWGTKQLLSDSVRRDRLFTLESIDWGFMRPRRPNDRTLAYAQSEWMVEYIIERYRYQAILKFLKAFRDGLAQAPAFRRVLKIEPNAFDRDFKAWAAEQVGKWGLPVLAVEDPEEIRTKLRDKPDDSDLLARMAQAQWLDGEWETAEEASRRSLKANKDQPLALEILSRVIISKMLTEEKEATRRQLVGEAEPYLRRLQALRPDHPVAIKYLGYVEQAWEQWNEAIDFYQQYQRRFPEDPDTYRRLAGIYLRRKDIESALTQLESLFRLVEDEPAVARQIASIYTDRKEHGRASHWYRKALYIDPYDLDTHGALADAYFELGKYHKAEREYKVVTELVPDEAIGYEGLSRVHKAMGNRERAATYQRKADVLRGKKPNRDSQEHGLQ